MDVRAQQQQSPVLIGQFVGGWAYKRGSKATDGGYVLYSTDPNSSTNKTNVNISEVKNDVLNWLKKWPTNFYTVDKLLAANYGHGTNPYFLLTGPGSGPQYTQLYSINKMRYYFQVPPITNSVTIWAEIYHQIDPITQATNATPVYNIHSWTNSSSSPSSQTPYYTNDPTTNSITDYTEVVLIPLSLKQLNYPTSLGSTDMGGRSSMLINSPDGKDIAYITGDPQMPQLQARIANVPHSINIDWSLSITTERPERGTEDNQTYGPVTLPGDQPWNISTNFGTNVFNGGACMLTYKINGSTPISYQFKIRGKNPLDASAKGYMTNNSGVYRFAWAIAQHESRQGVRIYNQFNSGGDGTSNLEEPNYSADGKNGWGIFQRDDSAGGITVSTPQVYNWKNNTQVAVQEIVAKQAVQQRYFTVVAAQYPMQTEAKNPPISFMPNGTVVSMSAMEAGVITLYNGASGCPTNKLGTLIYQNPWVYNTNNPSGKKWEYHQNTNNYLYRVIFDEVEPNKSSQE